tara:strand:+ start:2189 stop:3103 length:915 start_codon:yes stop_codon:yes gene_type:complete
MKYKVLVGNGCSFTDFDEGESWVDKLGNIGGFLKTFNISEGGSGNKYILHNSISYLEQLKKKYDSSDILFVNQWTGTARQDVFVDEILGFNLKPIPRNPKLQEDEKPRKLGWACSGGSNDLIEVTKFGRIVKFAINFLQGRKEYDTDFANEGFELDIKSDFFQPYHGMYSNYHFNMIEYLSNILFLQYYLEQNNIDYIFFSSWDNITQHDYLGTFADLSKIPHINYLWKQVNQENWIYFDSNVQNLEYKKFIKSKSPYGGFWQFMSEDKERIDDWNHPTLKAHKDMGNHIHKLIKDETFSNIRL